MKFVSYVTLMVAGFLLGGCSTLDDLAYVRGTTPLAEEGITRYLVERRLGKGGSQLYRLMSIIGVPEKVASKGELLCKKDNDGSVIVSVYESNALSESQTVPSSKVCDHFFETLSKSLPALYPQFTGFEINIILADNGVEYGQGWQVFHEEEALVLEFVLGERKRNNLNGIFTELLLSHEILHLWRGFVERRDGYVRPARDSAYEEIAGILQMYCMNILVHDSLSLSRDYAWYNPYQFEDYFPETPYQVVMRLTEETASPKDRAKGKNLSYTLGNLYVRYKYFMRTDVGAIKVDLLNECRAVQSGMNVMARNLEEFFTQNDINWDYIRVKNIESVQK